MVSGGRGEDRDFCFPGCAGQIFPSFSCQKSGGKRGGGFPPGFWHIFGVNGAKQIRLLD